MQLDHVTIVAADCACLRNFFVEVAGMQEGARPAFGVPGYWLYLEHTPVLHLIEQTREQRDAGHAGATTALPPARIDHLALRIDSATGWHGLLRRLRERQLPYQLSGSPHPAAWPEQQLFVTPVPEVTVEFVIDSRRLA